MARTTAVSALLGTCLFAALLPTCTRGPSGSGQTEPALEPERWDLLWNDEFTGKTPDPSVWDFDLGNGKIVGNPGWGNNELEYYTSDAKNVFVRDGKLVVRAVREDRSDPSFGNGSFTSARLVTRGKKSFTYGRVEARMKLPAGKGLWPAFWMMPEPVPGTGAGSYGGWAASGEVDIMEARGSAPGKIGGTLHYGGTWPNNTFTGKEFAFPGSGITEFHTYAVEWEPGEFRWYADGTLYGTQKSWYSRKPDGNYNEYPAPFNRPFHVILNLAVGGNYDGNPPEDAGYFPAEMEVEYVRVYRKRGEYSRKVDPPVAEREPVPDGFRKPDDRGGFILNGDFLEDANGDAVRSGQAGEPDLNAFDHDGNASTPGVNAFFADHWAHLNNAGGSSTVEVVNEGGNPSVSVSIASGGSEAHSVQLIQYVPLVKGHRYVLGFEASSTKNRTIHVKIGGDADRSWAAYAAHSFDLSGKRGRFSAAFVMNADTDPAARLEFNLGRDVGTVSVGNVSLVTEDLKTQTADGNLVYNHEFRIDAGEGVPGIPGTAGSAWWSFESGETSVGTVENDLDSEGKLRNFFVVTVPDASERVSLSQAVSLASGYDYRVSFDALGTQDRTLDVRLSGKAGGKPAAYAVEKDVPLRPIAKRFEFTFVMKEPTDRDALLEFIPGAGRGKAAVTNVRLIELGPHEDTSGVRAPDESGNLLRDISFSGGIADNDGSSPWAFYLHKDGGASADVSVSADGGTTAATFAFAAVGNAVWNSQLFQTEVQLESGKKYVFSFRARASAPRDIVGKIIHASTYAYYSAANEAGATVSLGTDWKTYSFPFTKRGSDLRAKVEFDLGPVAKTRADWNGTVQIADVRLEYAP